MGASQREGQIALKGNGMDFDSVLPSIWLVFGGTSLNHSNAPRFEVDTRELDLINLLSSYLTIELERFYSEKLYDGPTLNKLSAVNKLLNVWSEDLNLLHEIKVAGDDCELLVRQMARRLLKRVKTFEKFTIIPNGLTKVKHSQFILEPSSGSHDNTYLAILKRQNASIDWIQVNPGSSYHQRCRDLAYDKRNVYLAITDINPDDITEDWLYLLVGLKTVKPSYDPNHTEDSLYECLLAHLNGKTVFQSQPDEGFVECSHSSPVHTWQVIMYSFRYLLQIFIGDAYDVVYGKLLTGFKFFLMETTLNAYQNRTTEQMEECHFLLNEMSHDVAQQALNQGNEQQKQYALTLIDSVKEAIEQKCGKRELQKCKRFQLQETNVLSLSFAAPHLNNHNHTSGAVATSTFKTEPVYLPPRTEEDLIDFMKQFEIGFIKKLKNSKHLNEIALLSYGIQSFLIHHLANTDILQTSSFSPFSRDDEYLATILMEFAEIYSGCQAQLVNHSLSDGIYRPQFFAKNVTIQFFVYAAIAALNYRDRRIGPLLATHNLCIATSSSLTFDGIIPHLVIEDATWLKVLLSIKDFLTQKVDVPTLFSYRKFELCQFTFEINNNADLYDTDVKFAYNLLKKDVRAYACFTNDHLELDDERLNNKWKKLAYTDNYLPALYLSLSKIAHFAKVSLTGYSPSQNGNSPKMCWHFKSRKHWTSGYWDINRTCYFSCTVNLEINSSRGISTKLDSNQFTSYLMKPNLSNSENSYQRLIIREENIGKLESQSHFKENEIIASQDIKPNTMDRIRYLQLGFLQSEAQLKLERLYIALKDQQLDFSCEHDSVLIKQTLFEVSVLTKTDKRFCSLLEWTSQRNPLLIHKLGLLCVEKARALQYCLTQHHAIGEILEVMLGLLTFYPSAYKEEFVQGFVDLFHLLKTVLAQPSSHLSGAALLHLNAYLTISLQAKPQLLKTETLTVLKSLLAIQNYKVKGIRLENYLSLRVNFASFTWSLWMENQLHHEPSLLNHLMLSIIPQWDEASEWKKSKTGLLFTSGCYSIKPLLGEIYYQNQPIEGLPNTITEHHDFKGYLGEINFTVIPSSRKIETKEVECYLSVDATPQTRFTLMQGVLIIEECIEGRFQRYIPIEELSSQEKDHYPNFLFQSPNNEEKLTHWLDGDQSILIKNQQRHIIYQWNLKNNHLYSVQHKGFVVPWDNMESPDFQKWLNRIEESGWVELIAHQSTKDSAIHIKSLSFPRLGLHFDLKQGKYYSRQVHGYVLAKNQKINTLHGFANYLVLTKKEHNSLLQLTKVLVPHRIVQPVNSFFSKKVFASNRILHKDSVYIIYDLDPKTGLLKSHTIRAQLHLALLYYCSASLDDYDLSNCNAYHLARENLEVSWKDQPFDHIELDIIEQFLNPSVMRDFHSHRVALYLKVISLLSSSLRLAFLYNERSSLKSKERSNELLKKCEKDLPHLFRLYLQNKPSISKRIRLSLEEEEDVVKLCIPSFKMYHQLTFDQQSQVILSTGPGKSFKDSFKELFSEVSLKNTLFLSIFNEKFNYFSFVYDPKGVNLTSGIEEISIEPFRLNHFINLYKLAKLLPISIEKFCYLLHHLVIRAKNNYEFFPAVLVMMLARALLLVAENPAVFPDPPNWFGVDTCSVELFNRKFTESIVLESFPPFDWCPGKTYDTWNEEKVAKRNAEMAYERENRQIWSKFAIYDLDDHGIPLRLPKNPNSFLLQYENHLSNNNIKKQKILRDIYLKTAYNDSMYQFFHSILRICDERKRFSCMGVGVAPFIDNVIKRTVTAPSKSASSIPEPISLESFVISSQSIIDIDNFFTINSRTPQHADFLFESELREHNNDGYQKQFYHELKDSWFVFRNESEVSYSWLDSQSINNLKTTLQTKYDETRKGIIHLWDFISAQFKQRPNGELDSYFALQWHSGQVSHYHKGDILTLLVEPHKLVLYNPNCLPKQDSIIQKILQYVCLEINAAKIVRVLGKIEEYKQSKNEDERVSILNSLVKSLEENIDPVSFRYPHWLLFQLENEIIVRDNQRELIVAMLNQTGKAMYQLNMGEGKSSVILPLLSNNLANGQQLLRVNVLSALITTMKEFLRRRFSCMIRKKVYTLPFSRDTDTSAHNLALILQTLETCQRRQHILLVTPEHRLCLQLKVRELLLENQQQIGATDIFSWQTYRQRVQKIEVYRDLTEQEIEQLLAKQDSQLKACLINEKYIDKKDRILKVPPRGQGRKEFARFIETINDPTFREWSCLKAAYRELLYNSKLAHEDSSEKLALLNNINALTAIDLLDESDEILKHGTELNYTMGDKHVFAGGELRWQIPQFFINAMFCDPQLRLVLMKGKVDGFTACNMHYSHKGGVPFIQLLNESYYDDCIKPLLIDMFFLENLPILRKYNKSADINVLKNYVAGKLSLSEEKKVMADLADKCALKDKVLITKGWLSHGILFHVFNSKYRVQYGLNLFMQGQIPKPIAIPFTGKDTPSPRSEFGHPDVMLGLTIISYLYEGLNHQQLKATLLKLRDTYSHQVADIFLQKWTEASRSWIEPQVESFPPIMLTSLKNLDLSDEQCLNKVHQYLSANHFAVFFYLNQFILIQEAMQFLHKISANAHSLVGYDAALGFSGTDDRKLTMPYQIKSLRSTTQEGTNGKLLSVLTQERNSFYYSVQAEDTNTLLEELCHYIAEHPHCHALIDAGALVTGLTNYEVASFLLVNLPHNFSGILYFSDEGNSLTVLTRDKRTTSLQDCYLDKQYLFAYLDDIHTRGTDIKLPLNCHAILTIGMDMQKDKLMQAAMRLRQLAQKQSVSLWGTQVVTLAIARGNSVDAAKINSFEVIKWVTRNTIDRINADLFSVAVRKVNFEILKKAEAWLKIAPTTVDCLLQHCQEKELFSLEEFYGLSPQRQDLADRLIWMTAGRIRMFWQEIDEELRKKQLNGTDFYVAIFNQSDKNIFRDRLDSICKEAAVYLQVGFIHSSLEEDEEKEVEVEIIQEKEGLIKIENRQACQETEWDPRLILKRNFISLAEKKSIIMPLEAIKHFVRIPADLKNIVWHSNIYMTKNFIQSVKSKPKEPLDNYLRPVDTLLIHRFLSETKIVLLSGQEASEIKSACYPESDIILLVHLCDINGPTQLPTGSSVSKEEEKLLTILKLFAGECNYASPSEALRLARRVGRLYPQYFTRLNMEINRNCSMNLYGLLIENGYLDYSGILTGKLAKVLNQTESGESAILDLPSEYLTYGPQLLQKLSGIYNKLITKQTNSLRDSHYILWQWVGTRGRLKEYIGSVLESIINSEYQIKC